MERELTRLIWNQEPLSPSLYEPEMKQLAIKLENEYGFVIRSMWRLDLTFGSVKTDLWSGRIPFKEDSPWQEFPACSNDISNKLMLESSY